MEIEKFKKQMSERGWWIFPEFITADLVSEMIHDLEKSYKHCRELQITNGVGQSEGTCHHLIGQAHSFIECLSEYEGLDPYFSEYFQGKYILNSFGGNILRRDFSYANKIHRDIGSFSGSLPLMLNTIVMLDDFTETNGATWLMHRGHKWENVPNEDEFTQGSFQLLGKAGSVAVFNSNMWHRAGQNMTDKPRRSVTPELTRPFIRQGFDYPRKLGYDYGYAYRPYLQQILGYNSRTPSTLNQWYSKDRFYKEDQG